MKLKYEMTVITIDGSPVAVPVDGADEFRGILRMNETASRILGILKADVTEEEIVDALKEDYDAPDEQIRHSVQKMLVTLRDNELLID